MSITQKDVERIARLARLELSPAEKERYEKDLNTILSYMEQIHDVDTSHVEIIDRVIELPPHLREDVVTPSLPVEAALANAPAREGNFFKVPKVIG